MRTCTDGSEQSPCKSFALHRPGRSRIADASKSGISVPWRNTPQAAGSADDARRAGNVNACA
jgi:hypothetical protein